MMSCWKMVGLGLLVGGLAAACTVTSDDDDDTGAGGSVTTYTGGTGGTAGGGGAATGATGGVTETGGTGGTSPTAATDQNCFNCLVQVCDYTDCDASAACEPQLSEFRLCAYERQHGLQADQNGVPEEYGQAQEDTCVNVVDNGEINNLAPGVSDVIGCANDAGLSCQAMCFVFTT